VRGTVDRATPELWLARHGETPWSRDWLHTSVTDVPLTEQGVEDALALRPRLEVPAFALVLTSPRRRARHTAELAGFPEAVVDDDLAEWDYGSYEGLSTATIRETVPGWSVWTHPVPGGETVEDVAQRVERVLVRARAAGGDVLVFGHAHALRVLTARWLGLPPAEGRLFRLDTGSLSVLGHERETPVIRTWNVPA
jgi:probable phosphoglycerate mutase